VKLQKSVFKSKTFWFGIVSALAPLFPAVGSFLSENVGVVGMLWGSATVILRLVTKDKVILID